MNKFIRCLWSRVLQPLKLLARGLGTWFVLLRRLLGATVVRLCLRGLALGVLIGRLLLLLLLRLGLGLRLRALGRVGLLRLPRAAPVRRLGRLWCTRRRLLLRRRRS